MKLRTLCLLILCCVYKIASSETALDSLYAVWEDETQSDSLRISAYKNYILEGYGFSQPDTAFLLAKELHRYAEENSYPNALALAYYIRGVVSSNQGDIAKAIDYYEQNLEVLEEIGDQRKIQRRLKKIGNLYFKNFEYVKALSYYQRSLDVGEEIGNQKEIADALNNVAKVHNRLSEFAEALACYTRSLDIYEGLGDQKFIAFTLGRIGRLYRGNKEYDLAFDYINQALEIYNQIEDQKGVAGWLWELGYIYQAQENYPKALELFHQSLKIHEETGNSYGVAGSLSNIGKVYTNQGKYLEAMDYYFESLKINEAEGDSLTTANVQLRIGRNYYELENYLKARNFCKKSYDFGVRTSALSLQMSSCRCLYESYKATGDGDKALVYLEEIQVLDNILDAKKNKEKFLLLEFHKQVYIDSVEKVEEVRLVREAHAAEVSQNEKIRNMLIGIGLLALLLAGGFYSRSRYIRKSRDLISKEKDRSENLLLNILPSEIAKELKMKGEADARNFEQVSVLFTDFQSFTNISEQIGVKELVAEMNHCFKAFDTICEEFNVEKIKTIGDSFMIAGGLPVPYKDSVINTVLAGIEMAQFIIQRKSERQAQGAIAFEMRTGIHTGNVVAGIIGVKKFQYDVWGDTVNTASRMESHGEVGKVNISKATYDLVKNDSRLAFEYRGKIDAKGKGALDMWFVSLV